MLRTLIFSLLFSTSFLVAQNSYAQIASGDSTVIHDFFTLKVAAKKTLSTKLYRKYTSILFQVKSESSTPMRVLLNNETYNVNTSILGEEADANSNFIVSQQPFSTLSIFSASEIEIEVECFYTPSIDYLILPLKKKKQGNCEKPTTIPPSIWRQGLPEPKTGRAATTVNHCIVHHTAGSNTDTNYLNIVRNIYVYHTQSNGWDDIGYNYLIAQDGTIFSGRDAQGLADEDNIQGAHFCGKNSGTMGVCLLGNYNTSQPTPSALQSLTTLLSWKLHKENLSAYDSFLHPDAGGSYLSTIAGHRHGCATECPGDHLLALLPALRDSVSNQLEKCIPSSITLQDQNSATLLYPNPNTGIFWIDQYPNHTYSTYTITNTLGQVMLTGKLSSFTKINTQLQTGFYRVELRTENGQVSHKSFLIQSN